MSQIQVEVPEVGAFETRAISVVDAARAATVTSPERHRAAQALLRDGVVPMEREIVAAFRPAKEAAHAAHGAICQLEKRLLAPVVAAKGVLTTEIGRYEDAEEARRVAKEREAQAKRDAEIAKERAAREAELRREADLRRKAEEAAADDRRKAALAEAATLKAQGDAKAAREAQARAEKDAADAKARAKADADQAKADAAALAAAQIQDEVVTVAPRVEDAAGVSSRETWSAVIDNTPALIRWLATKNEAEIAAYVPADKFPMAALNAQARAMKAALAIPGVRAVCERSKAVRTAK